MKDYNDILNEVCREQGWRDSTEAYYGLDYTPFLSLCEEAGTRYKNQFIKILNK